MHISTFSPVTGSLPAGTEAPWRWSSPPGSLAGTRRWASPRALSSSRSASAHGGIQGTQLGTASCSHALPGLTPPGSPYLRGQKEMWWWQQIITVTWLLMTNRLINAVDAGTWRQDLHLTLMIKPLQINRLIPCCVTRPEKWHYPCLDRAPGLWWPVQSAGSQMTRHQI